MYYIHHIPDCLSDYNKYSFPIIFRGLGDIPTLISYGKDLKQLQFSKSTVDLNTEWISL